MRRAITVASAGIIIALAACSPQSGGAQATPAVESSAAAANHPVSGLKVIPLIVESKGKTHRFKVELAASPKEQQQGLMFRTEMGPNEGMIFPSVPQSERSFWMKNTPLPLDIIFVGTDGRILNIAANTPPYTLESVHSAGATSGVLELIGGRAAELGIAPGDLVKW